MRTINVDGRHWEYNVGKFSVMIRGDQGTRFVVSCAQLAGVSQEEWERGRWKKTSMVTPRLVADYIREKSS